MSASLAQINFHTAAGLQVDSIVVDDQLFRWSGRFSDGDNKEGAVYVCDRCATRVKELLTDLPDLLSRHAASHKES